jgi:hypothetical protein
MQVNEVNMQQKSKDNYLIIIHRFIYILTYFSRNKRSFIAILRIFLFILRTSLFFVAKNII